MNTADVGDATWVQNNASVAHAQAELDHILTSSYEALTERVAESVHWTCLVATAPWQSAQLETLLLIFFLMITETPGPLGTWKLLQKNEVFAEQSKSDLLAFIGVSKANISQSILQEWEHRQEDSASFYTPLGYVILIIYFCCPIVTHKKGQGQAESGVWDVSVNIDKTPLQGITGSQLNSADSHSVGFSSACLLQCRFVSLLLSLVAIVSIRPLCLKCT